MQTGYPVMALNSEHRTYSLNTTVCGRSNTQWITRHPVSLVPRLFPPPVFDHLQYANMEGEGLGDFVTCSYIR